MNQQDEINEFLTLRGTPFRLPSPWDRIKCHEGFCTLDEHPAQLLLDLHAQFADEDLLRAGAVVASAENMAAINPALVGNGEPTLALRRSSKRKPFCLLSEGRCLAARQWPLSAIAEDYRTLAFQRQLGRQLLVAGSMADVAVLWSLGVPAAPATGLSTLSRGQIDVFCKLMGIPRYSSILRKADANTGGNRQKSAITLILVGWSPALLDIGQPAEIKDVRDHLKKLHTNLGIALDDVLVWTPDEAALTRMRTCLDVGTPRDVEAAVIDSLEANSTPLVETKVRRAVRLGYADALSKWMAVQAGPVDRRKRQQAWDDLQQQYHLEMIEPLLREAEKSDDLNRRTLGIAQATVLSALHKQGVLLNTKYDNAARNDGGKGSVVLPSDDLKQLLSTAERLRSVTHERQVCARTQQRPAESAPPAHP